MYYYKLLLIACVAISCANAFLTDAQKFYGVFQYLNTTLYSADGTATPYYANGPTGGIRYIPAYPGASYGNMSVVWGEQVPGGAAATPEVILAHQSSYTGSYDLDVANKIVNHHPTAGVLVYLQGQTQVRYYTFYDDDNILNLRVINNGFVVGSLFWRRTYTRPINNACSIALSTTIQSSWISNGERHTRYTVSASNNGAQALTSATIDAYTPGGDVEATSQVTRDNSVASWWTAPLYGLAVGASSDIAQFQVIGSGSPLFRLAKLQC